jgi:hypothetical protein
MYGTAESKFVITVAPPNDYSLLFGYNIAFDCNLLKIVLMILVLEYVHIARRPQFLVEIKNIG